MRQATMGAGALTLDKPTPYGKKAASILAVDAGFVACGWAVLCAGRIVATGCIRTERSEHKKALRVADDDAERCALIARSLARIVREHQVSGIVAELPGAGAKGARAISCMARAGAILATVAELLSLPTEWVTPSDVKKITGSRAASKLDVETVVLARWPRASLPKVKAEREHVADALGAYLAAEHGQLVRILIGGGRAQ